MSKKAQEVAKTLPEDETFDELLSEYTKMTKQRQEIKNHLQAMENLIRPQIVNRQLPRSAEMPNDLFKRKKDEMRRNPYYQKMMKYMPKELRNELANDDKAENELAFSGGEEESFNESQN